VVECICKGWGSIPNTAKNFEERTNISNKKEREIRGIIKKAPLPKG
jgi:hypothetical protein